MTGSARITALCARARLECPELALGDDALGAHLVAIHGDALAALDLDQLHAGDLRLVAACLQADPAALDLLDRRYLRGLTGVLRTVDPSPSFADEVIQVVRHKLLVADGATPARLASYAGTGPLGGWLRVTALRTALGLRRQNWREVPVEDRLAMVEHGARTPQQDVAHAQHAAALREALTAAVATQPSRMRTLLRYYYLDGVGVEELGRLYRVHASTVSRWLSSTREAILDETRRRIAASLALAESEVESMLGLSGSLEISLGTLLRTNPGK